MRIFGDTLDPTAAGPHRDGRFVAGRAADGAGVRYGGAMRSIVVERSGEDEGGEQDDQQREPRAAEQHRGGGLHEHEREHSGWDL